MTNEEQMMICKAIARSCMWGQRGIGSVILDELQKQFPMERKWQEVHREHAKEAKREAVGVVKDEAELQFWLSRGYWLCNYEPGELSLFNPPPMNGLHMYVVGEMADQYGKLHDPHNYGVCQQRASHSGEER